MSKMLIHTVTALFTRKDSIYRYLLSDVYDKERNALNYQGTNPVICHPPCRSWGRLRGQANYIKEEHEMALFAVEKIRKNGGILEHPVSSKLFGNVLPYPGTKDQFGGYSICIDQFWFGHPCKKKTLLYICHIDEYSMPPLPLNFNCIQHVISTPKRRKSGIRSSIKREVSKADRERTPAGLAIWLILACTQVRINLNKTGNEPICPKTQTL